MGITSKLHPAGFPVFTIANDDQEVVISAFGGQILSWTVGGVPIVFENKEHAISDGKTPYRGGAPLCFSFFGKGSLLPHGTNLDGQHGAARTTIWDANVLNSENKIFLTTHQPSPEGYGPTEFSCELLYTLGDGLSIQATIRNIGESPSPFQFVVHTYWATNSPSTARVEGIGNRYLDNLLGLTEQTEADSSLPHLAPFDRIYLDAGSKQTLTLETHRVEIETSGCHGAVFWNPGFHHSIKDLGSPDFVCLESGVVSPSQTLLPGQEYKVEIAYLVHLT